MQTLKKRNATDAGSLLCAAGVLTCILREISFSTLWEKPALLLLLMLLIWFSLWFDKPDRASVPANISKKGVFAILLLLTAGFGTLQTRQQIALRHNRAALRAYYEGDSPTAIKEIEKSLNSFPKNALLHANKGLLMGQQNDSLIQQTVHCFETAVALHPADAAFQAQLGILHILQGDTLRGSLYVETAIRLAPCQSIYHILYGTVNKHDSLTAQQSYAQAVYLAPELLDSRWFADEYSANAERMAAVVRQAERMLADSLALNNSPLAKARLAKLHLHQGQTAEAEKLLNEVIAAMPNLNRTWLMLGDIAATRSDTLALHYYERAIKLDPADAQAQVHTGDWYMRKNNLPKAFGYYMDALRRAYHASTEHSIRCYSIYCTPTVANDMLPDNLLWYVKPDIQPRKLAEIIAQGFEQEGNTERAKLYRAFANGEISLRQVMNHKKSIFFKYITC